MVLSMDFDFVMFVKSFDLKSSSPLIDLCACECGTESNWGAVPRGKLKCSPESVWPMLAVTMM